MSGTHSKLFNRLSIKKYIRAHSEVSLKEKDCLHIVGNLSDIESFVLANQLQFGEIKSEAEKYKQLVFKQYGISEFLIPPHSTFINKTTSEIDFRKKYECNIVSISRDRDYAYTNLSSTKFKSGDAVILHGEWERIEDLAEQHADISIVGSIDEKVSIARARGKALLAGLIVITMMLLMTFEIVSSVTAVLLAALGMLITGCLSSLDEAYRKIQWESIVLFASMIPVATALEKTGGVDLISNGIILTLGKYGPFAVLAGYYVLTMILSQFISNTATAVIFAPISITSAITLGVSPYPFVIAVAIAASMAFATPIASPTNMLVMKDGGYSFRDFTKVGIPLQIIAGIVLIFCIPLFYPF